MVYRKTLLPTLFAFLLVLAAACKKDPAGPNDNPPLTGGQVNIPWPGLANSPWPARNHDPQHTGRSEYRGPQLGRMGWRFDVQSPAPLNNVFASPVLAIDGTIYFGNAQSRDIVALQPGGIELWKSNPGGGSGSCIVGSDGTIYCSGQANDAPRLYAYSPAGTLKWSFPMTDRQGYGTYTPMISKDGETIYVPNGILYAITKEGTLRWKLAPDSTGKLYLYPSMSPDGRTIYVQSQLALYAVDSSGLLKWRFTPVTGEAAIDNSGNLYVTAGSDDLYSLTPQGGVRWHLSGLSHGGYQASPVIGWDGTIYLIGTALWAVSDQGTLKWTFALPAYALSQCVPAIDIDGTIYFGRGGVAPSDSLNFFAVKPDGTLRFRMTLRGSEGLPPDIDSNPAISSTGKIYVGSDGPSGHYIFEIQ